MKAKRFILHFSIIGLAGILPLLTVQIIGLCQGPRYDASFYGGLSIKDNRLTSLKGKNKIVFLGGSSLSFGLRSEMMSEALGYEVVDYGLYAPLGTKTMAELAKSKIEKGDIVVFAPEISAETYSTRINYNMFLKCIEKNFDLFNRLSLDDRMQVVANYPYFISERAVDEIKLNAPYDKASFNEYGDIESDKVQNNVMLEFYDSSQMVSPKASLLDKDFISYVNGYSKEMERRGAKTYFTFSPTNALALQEENLSEFESGLREKLNFKVIGDVKSYTYHQNYFFDTNYHLNYAGTILHSKNLSEDFAEELGLNLSYEFPEVPMPRAQYEEPEEPQEIPEDELFVTENKGGEIFLTGLHESLKEKEAIVVPDQIGDKPIVGIARDAFKDFIKLRTIILPSQVDNLANGIFSGCSSLEKIYLRNESAPSVVGNGFLEGCNENVKIYILKSARRSYTGGYTWANYSDHFVLYELEEIEPYISENKGDV